MKKLGLVVLVGLNACTANGVVAGSEPFEGSGGGSSDPRPTPGKGVGGVGPRVEPVDLTDPVVVADPAPPPISGGTLLVSSSTRQAVVSDPDRDQLVVVDLDEPKVKSAIALEAGDEPGRLVEDAAGHVHVALRGSGTVVSIDPSAGSVLERRAVCAYPRGLAYDDTADVLHVACAEGLLVTLPAATGEPTRRLTLERDLRDVVVENGRLWVSVFRSAEVLRIEADGTIAERQRAPVLTVFDSPTAAPAVAWRLIADPLGGVLMLHQRATLGEIVIEEGGYGAGNTCGGIVEGAVTHFEPGAPPQTSTIGLTAALAVDLTVHGDRLMLASAGAVQSGQLNVFFAATPTFLRSELVLSGTPEFAGCGFFTSAVGSLTVAGQAVAVGYDDGTPVVQMREPSMLVVGDKAVSLPGDSKLDTGHLLFHAATGIGLACASCHPEGREDGHTWNFAGFGPRRTQSIGGVLAGTAPFHWAGDEEDFPALVNDVMTGRIMGPLLTAEHAVALQDWIDAIPAWATPAPADAEAITRGRAVFESEQTACATCHAGEKLTNNKTYDVGTGAELQVPSLLGLVWRAPFMHDGCAPSIESRFESCGGTQHGDVSGLSEAELGDLVTYLKSL